MRKDQECFRSGATGRRSRDSCRAKAVSDGDEVTEPCAYDEKRPEEQLVVWLAVQLRASRTSSCTELALGRMRGCIMEEYC